ncbi:hypothetical protein OCA8868_01130 [Octadecabacter ascidiaceicola]|uniref:Uncharacterized protein n=1 Tax=Octadecabacter ascidiaceicola TaxID=1655543 RepID=A0A238K409_9RHOB|nr:hypothetical protein OCA8868_01130 [Octadecabacter ascidiaceicola]
MGHGSGYDLLEKVLIEWVNYGSIYTVAIE